MKLPSWVSPVVRTSLNVTLPAVLAEVRRRLEENPKLTQNACLKIPGYYTIRRWYPHSRIVGMARGTIPIRLPESLR